MANDTNETEVSRPRAAVRSGAIALICSVFLVLWVALAVQLAVQAPGNETAAVLTGIIFVASWAIVPGLILAVLAFGIIALLLNRLLGKIMGALGIALPIAAAVVFWGAIGGFSAAFLG